MLFNKKPLIDLIKITPVLTFLFLINGLVNIAISSERVYVIHGYGSAPIFMAGIEKTLNQNGFTARNLGYNSLGNDLLVIGKDLYELVKKENKKGEQVCFVTHSMGGLVVRSMLRYAEKDTDFPKIARIVMLTPPNKGAEIADFFANIAVLQWILGPNIQHLRTDSSSLANNLPAIPKSTELGIIVGAKFDGKGYNPLIKGDNDGFLSIDKTQLKTGKEYITVPEAHMMIIQDRNIQNRIVGFLQKGYF